MSRFEDPEVAKILVSIGELGKVQKLLLSHYVQPAISILVAWDSSNNCYRRILCDSSGKVNF